MGQLLDPERDDLRRILPNIVERVAIRQHATYRARANMAALPWESSTEIDRKFWRRCAWESVVKEIGRTGLYERGR
jgi:hypothetical protein